MRAAARLLPVLGLVLVAVGPGASADAPSTLQVYEAQSAASPVAIITKVPAESDGGLVFASSHVEIGKALASAAGETLGPLGDAFVVTSVPGFSNPTAVTAQYPPSAVFPASATGSTSLAGGGGAATTFHATADASPSAVGDAVGGAATEGGVVHIGGATSHSESHVDSHGTVETSATSTISNLTLGPAGASLVTIGSMTSTASVTVPFGQQPRHSASVEMSGVLVGGVPVAITQDGITVAGSLPVPATGVATVDSALKQLAAAGVTLSAVPVSTTATAIGATTMGAALEIGYVVPTSLLGALPTDIGTNETILLGSVTASATGRPRVPLGLPPTLSPPSLSPLSGVAVPSIGSVPTAPASAPVANPAAPPLALTAPAGPSASLFTLPKRTRNLAAAKLVIGYRMFIIAAIACAGAFVVCRRAES